MSTTNDTMTNPPAPYGELTVRYRGHTLRYSFFYEVCDYVAEIDGLDPTDPDDEVRIERKAQHLDRKAHILSLMDERRDVEEGLCMRGRPASDAVGMLERLGRTTDVPDATPARVMTMADERSTVAGHDLDATTKAQLSSLGARPAPAEYLEQHDSGTLLCLALTLTLTFGKMFFFKDGYDDDDGSFNTNK